MTEITGKTTSWETKREAAVASLQGAFRRRPFMVGAVGYPPFVFRNGVIEGPLVEYLRDVAGEFGTSLEVVPCTWSELRQKLINRDLDTACDPVLPSRQRPFDLVPYITVTTPHIVFHRKREGPVRRAIESMAGHRRAAQASGDKNAYFRATRKDMHDIHNIGKGFAVTTGTAEEDLLGHFFVSGRAVEGSDIVENGLSALSDDYIYCADGPSTELIIEQAKKRGIFYESQPLFENARVFAGFALAPMDEALQNFFLAEVHQDGSLLRRKLGRIEETRLRNIGIEILPPGRIPSEPLVGARFASDGPEELAGGPQQVDLLASPKAGRALPPGGEMGYAETVSNLGTARHRYPLIRDVTLQYDGSCVTFAGIEGHGQSREEAIEDLGSQLHRRFQHLRRIPPHDRSLEEENAWRSLGSAIDLQRYEESNPRYERVLGRVLEATETLVKLELITEQAGPLEYYLDDLPPEAGAVRAGDWFEAQVRRFADHIEWVTWQWREPLLNDSSVWDAFEDPCENGEAG